MVFITDLQGQTQVYNLDQDLTTSELKQKIYERTQISPEFQRLIYQGAQLEDTQVLSAQLLEESTLYLTLGLSGGKKGKKKNYTTKKKNKHKHKSTKLSTLKYYSIDKDNKVVRVRKVCVNCGPGFFMAKNIDRHYCGRCHLTLKLDAAAIKAAQEALKHKIKEKPAEGEVEETKGKKEGKKGGKKK